MPLEKLSIVNFDFRTGLIEKRHQTIMLAESERATLKALHDLRNAGKTNFLSPDPQMELSGRDSTVMTYLPGIPLLDLILAGARIAQTSGEAFQKSFLKWREQIAADALKDIAEFQSPVVQNALAHELQSISHAYDYAGKLKEAVRYTCTILGRIFDDTLETEIEVLGKLIKSHPQVYFLDPILTNRIFHPENFPALSALMMARHHNTNKPGNSKVNDDEMVRTIILSNDLRSEASHRTYNIDFELTHHKVGVADDWGHVLILQGVDCPAAQFLPFISQATGVSEKQVSETITARCFREWARKLYYKIESPDTFDARYRNENFMHTLNHATSALQHVNDMTPENPFQNLLNLFLECARAPQCQYASPLVDGTTNKPALELGL